MTIDTVNYSRCFAGISRLYGEENRAKLAAARVAIIGLGGVGSWVAEVLARSAVGDLTLIDLDQVSESNINRQLPALIGNFGRAKTAVLSERIAAINPHCRVRVVEDFVDTDNLGTIFARPFTFVVDAIDAVNIKTLLINHFLQSGQAFAVCGGAGGKKAATAVRSGDLSAVTHDRLLAPVRYRLRKQYNYPGSGPLGVFCVYSQEPAVLPAACSPADLSNGLACAGYGSSMVVTAAMAMQLAEAAIGAILR